MDYTMLAAPAGHLTMPSLLPGFVQDEVGTATLPSGRDAIVFRGHLDDAHVGRTCECGRPMHVNGDAPVKLRHLPYGGALTVVVARRPQLECPSCGATRTSEVPFREPGHMITSPLGEYARDLLAQGDYTLREVGRICGIGKNVVKAIDLARLLSVYAEEGGTRLRKPGRRARYLGIDEFKLHDGHRYATHVMDLETGHVLWVRHGRKKQVAYDFVDHVGLEWMAGVAAVACDMNSDFCEGFLERCPHLRIVFDRLHIVKNFNDKVASAVRKDEQARLKEEGDEAAAKSLRGSKYVLASSRGTLLRKDGEAAAGKVVRKGSALFGTEDAGRRGGHVERDGALLASNSLLFALDLVKEHLDAACRLHDERAMRLAVDDIVAVCEGTGDSHFRWFANLPSNHVDGIVSHARYAISSGRVEGANNRIKTIRRQGYGYPDDEYFFLKIIDSSRKRYVENPKSHIFSD